MKCSPDPRSSGAGRASALWPEIRRPLKEMRGEVGGRDCPWKIKCKIIPQSRGCNVNRRKQTPRSEGTQMVIGLIVLNLPRNQHVN